MGRRRNPGCQSISHIAYLSENIVRGQYWAPWPRLHPGPAGRSDSKVRWLRSGRFFAMTTAPGGGLNHHKQRIWGEARNVASRVNTVASSRFCGDGDEAIVHLGTSGMPGLGGYRPRSAH